jgi:hypothetical protein
MTTIIIDKDKFESLKQHLNYMVINSMRNRTAKEKLNTLLNNLEATLILINEIKEVNKK